MSNAGCNPISLLAWQDLEMWGRRGGIAEAGILALSIYKGHKVGRRSGSI